MDGGDVAGANATVDLDRHLDETCELLDASERLRHEVLPGVAGVDAHAEHDVGAGEAHGLRRGLRSRLGVEDDADAEAERAGGIGDAGSVVGRLHVERHRVTAGGGDLLEVVRGVGDHQVAVEHAAPRVHQRSDRPQDDRADRHRGHEVPVPDVEMEDAAARVEQPLDLLAEAREVGRVQRRLDLDVIADPVAPPHATIVTAPTAL